MGIFEDNILQAEEIISDLENQLNTEKAKLEDLKKSQKNLYDNYTKSPLDIDQVDNEIMDLDDEIRTSDAKIKGLDARILNRKRSLLLYKFK
jgi:uncharacterized coiled-coil DUF342 family protein